MTFDPSVPNASQSPGLFPPQNSANFTQLKKIIVADHVFNDTAQDSDGFHKQVTLFNRATPVSFTGGANGILYSNVDASSVTQLFFYNGVTNFQITPQLPAIRATVNFSNSGAIRSQFNVSTVTHNGIGDYTINFTNPMPNTNYIVHVTGQRQTSGDVSTGCINGGGTFSGVATLTSVRVNFFGSTDSLKDITTGCVTIMSVT